MKVAVIYNEEVASESDVINILGQQNKEVYNPITVEAVASSLEKGGHNVRVIKGNINVADELQGFMPRVMAGELPGMVFNMAYGIQGQSRYTHIPATLEMLGVPYVGSGPQAHAVALDKVMSKIIFQRYNIPTPDFWVFNNSSEVMDDVVYPVIVKPKMESVSMGIRIVNNQEDLRDAVQFIVTTFHQPALVEAFIPGQEFAIGMLGNGSELEILPIVEIDLQGDPNAIQTLEDKKQNPPRKICPAEIPEETAGEMRRLARESFHALEIFDFARIDLRMDAEGNLFVLELNSMASLGRSGSYVHAASKAGYNYAALVNRMLDVAAKRYFGEVVLSRPPEKDDLEKRTSQPLRARVRQHVRSHQPTTIENLKKMVEINSYYLNTDGVNQMGEWVSRRLGHIGFQLQRFPQTEVGDILYFRNHGEAENDILVLGSLDTENQHQDYVPFRQERGRIWGSGVAESKGGLAVLLAALQALRYTRRLRKMRCGILLTTDKALGGRYSAARVREFAGQSHCVVGLKYGDLKGEVITSCVGRADFQFELINSKLASQTAIPDVIRTVCQKMISWGKLADDREGILLKPVRLEARAFSSPAPDMASGALQVRFKTNEQGEAVEKQIRRIAQSGLGSRLHMRLSRTVYRPAFGERDTTQRFYNHVSGIARRLEVRLSAGHRTTSSDICYVPEEIPALDGLGPLGGYDNLGSEHILRDSLADRAAILAMVIRLSSEES
jgi:D-alanine-D-alanine ligase